MTTEVMIIEVADIEGFSFFLYFNNYFLKIVAKTFDVKVVLMDVFLHHARLVTKCWYKICLRVFLGRLE